MPIDHVAIAVPPADLEKVVEHYTAALAPLTYKEAMRPDKYVVGFGAGPECVPDFWVAAARDRNVYGAHVAFVAKDNKAVDETYAAAIEAGGIDNGKPGLRPRYHPNYYGAFWKDVAGNPVEVVCHTGEQETK